MGALSHGVTLTRPLVGVVLVSLCAWLLPLRAPIAQAVVGLLLLVIIGLLLDPILRVMMRRLIGLPPRVLEVVPRS